MVGGLVGSGVKAKRCKRQQKSALWPHDHMTNAVLRLKKSAGVRLVGDDKLYMALVTVHNVFTIFMWVHYLEEEYQSHVSVCPLYNKLNNYIMLAGKDKLKPFRVYLCEYAGCEY